MFSITPLEIALYVTAGAAMGALYFVLLFQTAKLHAARTSTLRIVPLYFLRIVTVIAAFWMIAQQGPLPLLLALLGFLVARWIVQRRILSD